jgi:hypothetical protein
MVRLVLLVSFLMIACGGRDPQPMKPKEGELPPLPPASGTAIGYLVDSASVLKLSNEQLDKLKELDTSLAAKNDSIETQIRTMERPDEAPPEKDKPPPRHNNAPGAQVTSSPDAQKLHKARADNDAAALVKAFALFDDEQKQTATRLLSERGITAPGASKKEEARTEDNGKPLPGMEP